MKTFSLITRGGHLFVETEKAELLLVDTGSPSTLYTANQLPWMDRMFPASTNLMGRLTVAQLNAFLPYMNGQIAGLLGNDILGQYWVHFQAALGKIHLGQGDAPLPSHAVAYRDFMSIPLVPVVVGEVVTGVGFLDSGAQFSYVNGPIENYVESSGQEIDFYPGIGNFETPVYNYHADILGVQMPIRFAVLPAALRSFYTSSRAVAILGSDLFMQHDVIIDYPNKRVALN